MNCRKTADMVRSEPTYEWAMISSKLSLLLLLTLISPGLAAEPVAIPKLDPKGDVYKTCAENDWLIYDDAVGKKKLLMVYCDFEDKPMEMTTEERGKQCLGGDRFEEIFGTQSYGKLSYDITQVHGWRRLPGTSKDYNTKETDTHRAMFVAIFKLFPEVDFRKYDYICSVMPGVGNTAFGEREDIAIPYRDTKIKVAMNLASPNPETFAHEVGHLMGLPDLYTYGGVEGPKNPVGAWDLMSSSGASTGFLGWHRHKLAWLDADRKTYLTQSTTGLRLTPLHAKEGISMAVIPIDDPKKPSKVFVIEEAQALQFKGKKRVPAGGILVYTVDATLETGNNPVIVYPKKDLNDAPFKAGDTFQHEDAPFTMKVVEKKEDGSYLLDIVIQ